MRTLDELREPVFEGVPVEDKEAYIKKESGVKKIEVHKVKADHVMNQARKVAKLLDRKKKMQESIGSGTASTWD